MFIVLRDGTGYLKAVLTGQTVGAGLFGRLHD